MGGYEVVSLGIVEPTLKYHPLFVWNLIPHGRQRMVGSLTGVVASKRVTEAPKGTLMAIGNRQKSVMA